MIDCPSRDQLQKLLDDSLDRADHAAIEGHVERCPSCQGLLESLSGDPGEAEWKECLGPSSGPWTPGPGGRSISGGWVTHPAREAVPLQPPRAPDFLGRLDGYDIEAEIGQGAMGAVFRACDGRLARRLAVKVPWPHLAAQPKFLARFEREARAAAAAVDDHIVRIYEIGGGSEGAPLPYIAMELIEGESLQDRLDRDGRIPPREAAEIARQVTLGLAAAHARNLVHRDVKPSNILLDARSRRAKVADFGVARAVDASDSRLTAPDLKVGSPAYMSPEHINAPGR